MRILQAFRVDVRVLEGVVFMHFMPFLILPSFMLYTAELNAAMHFNSMAMGVGRLLISTVVRQG